MLRPRCDILTVGVVIWGIGVAPQLSIGQEASAKVTATKAVTHFWSRLEAKDLDGLVKAADVPFCFNEGNPDRIVEQVVRDRADLMKLLKEFIDGSKDMKRSLEISAAATYADFLKSTGDLLKQDGRLKQDRESLDEALSKEGYVIYAQGGKQGEELSVGFLVTTRKDGAKIVGILLGLTDPDKK